MANSPPSVAFGPALPLETLESEDLEAIRVEAVTQTALGYDQRDRLEGIERLLDPAQESPLIYLSEIERAIRDSPRADPRLWQVRSQIVEIQGITTQATAYTAGDAVGIGQWISGMGGPNNCLFIENMILLYDIVPTGTQTGLACGFFSAFMGNQTDNGPMAFADADILHFVGGGLVNQVTFPSAMPAIGNSITASAYPAATPLCPIPTSGNGALWFQGGCSNVFTIGAGGRVWLKLIYRYANFQGVA